VTYPTRERIDYLFARALRGRDDSLSIVIQ
jgi:hypothetical protein